MTRGPRHSARKRSTAHVAYKAPRQLVATRANVTINSPVNIHRLMNNVDAKKDATHVDSTIKIKEPSLDNFKGLVNTIFDIGHLAVNSYVSNYRVLENLVKKYKGSDSIQTLLICRLEYFQNASKKLSLPTIKVNLNINALNDPQLIANTGVEYGVQDSGKTPQAFGENIRTVITPATYIDPAPRTRNDMETVFMTGMDVPADVFKLYGMDMIESFKVKGCNRALCEFNIKTDMSRESDTLTVNVATLKPYDSGPFNKTILGNPTKNMWFNEHYKIKDQVIPNRTMATKYIIMKLLGDLLQVYYTKKLIFNNLLNIGNTCIFTSDKVLAMRALLEDVPCLIEILGFAKYGCDKHIYQFTRKVGSGMTFEQINIHSANKIFQHNFEVHRRLMQVVTNRYANIYVDTNLVVVNDTVKSYILDMATKVINTCIYIYRIMNNEVVDSTINLTLKPETFRQHISIYMAIDIFNITNDRFNALVIKRMFPLLTTYDNNTYKQLNMPFKQFVYNNRISNVGGNYKLMKGGYRCSELILHNPVDYEMLLNSCVPHIAVLKIIGDILATYTNPFTPEDIFTILFPYFIHVGSFSVNYTFYLWCIGQIYTNYVLDSSDYFNIDAFTKKYNSIHDVIVKSEVSNKLQSKHTMIVSKFNRTLKGKPVSKHINPYSGINIMGHRKFNRTLKGNTDSKHINQYNGINIVGPSNFTHRIPA